MKENRGSTLFSLLILVVLAVGVYYIVRTVQDTADKTLSPIQQANSSLQTQVADLLYPTPTIIPDPVTYINQIQALARLETIEYSVQQVVEVDDKQGTFAFLYGTKMLIQVKGKVIAGIDMQKLQPGDMQLQTSVLYVKLPPAEIFITALDESKTQIWNIQNGIFTRPDPNLVIDGLQGAQDKIYQAALEDGILDQAQKNAEAYLTKFFAALGYKNTIFVK
ncbi:MAG: DUF4230 domain-containing protein [Chloroflexi bacterium]|nr:DUF4230 domain-containing protein [Chloroflexota bacterium]MBI3339884.1 DUF4230 domain-containing protein [Chloroflexota bacterium]